MADFSFSLAEVSYTIRSLVLSAFSLVTPYVGCRTLYPLQLQMLALQILLVVVPGLYYRTLCIGHFVLTSGLVVTIFVYFQLRWSAG